MKVAVYVRVSTKDQTYEQQIEPCLNFCKMKGWTEVDIYKEVESSQKTRPVFEDVLRRAKEGQYKFIVVFRIDRAWRKSRQFIMDFDMLKARGIYVISVMEGLDPSTRLGEAMMTVIVVLAQLERDLISDATKQRLAVLKGTKYLGRPMGSKDKHKRNSFGYQLRWHKERGGKIENNITPETVILEKTT